MNYFNIREKAILVDHHLIEDFRKDDYLFLCSDGVWELFKEEELLSHFHKRKKTEEILSEIEQAIEGNMKDNSSAILIKIKESSNPWKRILKNFLSKTKIRKYNESR